MKWSFLCARLDCMHLLMLICQCMCVCTLSVICSRSCTTSIMTNLFSEWSVYLTNKDYATSCNTFLFLVKISFQQKQHAIIENEWGGKGLYQSHKGEGVLGSDRCPDQDLNLPCQKSWHWAPDPGCLVNTWPTADKRREINKSMCFQPHQGRGKGV